jgi:hypothetical protein
MQQIKRALSEESRKNTRTLHIFPHSHTDEGWLVTSQEMFTGDHDDYVLLGSVKDILTSTVENLLVNPDFTFCFAETKYFKMWWDLQNSQMKKAVRGLVQSGQLDLVSGGWSATDEAVSQYDSMLDNFMLGQQFLQKELGIHPRVSWQVDALGVGTGYARLAREVGFDMMIYSRIDHLEKKEMAKKKTRTQVWRPHEENMGKRGDILGITIGQDKNDSLGHYCWPTGFWADTNYPLDVPIILDKSNPNYRFDKLARALYEEANDYLATELTPHMFRPFGCDFAYVDADVNYAIIKHLFQVWDELGFNNDIQLLWSTPTKFMQYMKEVNDDWTKEGDKAWPIRRDDSFPYA